MSKRILVVEDELPLQRAVYQKFERDGHHVKAARTMDDALRILEEEGKVDLIWLDHYLLGRGTGLDFVKKIKKIPLYSSIPVVLVSNTASADRIEEYHHNGIHKCYTKSEHRLDEIMAEANKLLLNSKS
jgi:CheY-like chemotaxis protein